MVGAEPDELLDKNVFGDWIEVLIGAFEGSAGRPYRRTQRCLGAY